MHGVDGSEGEKGTASETRHNIVHKHKWYTLSTYTTTLWWIIGIYYYIIIIIKRTTHWSQTLLMTHTPQQGTVPAAGQVSND